VKRWPSLELRARITRRRKIRTALVGVEHVIAAVLPTQVPQRPQTLIDVLEDIDDAEMDELASHVKDCSNCKADLARAARSGAHIPDKLLVAAGIDILRN
jgi:hypothetical protein